ncbi:MAG TPA: endolytic transglycosylase MltG [Candidatus Andersenbacteria bacterium]|nr:endolytic transglycosylase MltG [Candidatus Andersenbacteria bacterium]
MISITNPKKFTVILLILVIVIGLGIFRFVWGSGAILKTGDVEISQGESGSQVWRQLIHDGYSDRTIPWKWYGRSGSADKIQAGIYHVEKGEKIKTVINRFISGDVSDSEVSITFPEGFTLQQIAERLEQHGIGTAKDFEKEAIVGNYADKFSFLADLSASRSLEGYLFPDTYRIAKNDTAHDVIMKMLGNFDRKISQEMRDQAKSQGRTLDQVVIIASIIEKEVFQQEDLPEVAGIFWKRLDQQLGLFADSTIRYALQKGDELTVKDLATDSPYNTRKYKDLPPTAIGNPGLIAIQAALNPQKSDYYYYLTTEDKKTIFAKTNAEHNANKAKYLK